MSVVLETTIGDITVDLYVKERPNACLNFLKLCKIKYYNLCIFHKVERNFIAQTGDPTATGRGGESIFSHLYGEQAKYFDAESKPRLKHEKLGTLSMVNNGNNMNGSQFFLTLGENITYLDEVHTVFGEVAEGFDILLKINEAICDPDNRPYQDIRITHTVVLHDPFEDPSALEIPDASPIPTREQLESNYIGADEEIDDTKGKNAEEIEEKIKESEAKARATILEMVGDIPDADVKPPENVLFVCKLNPVTTSEDLEIIFSRFGTIVSCEVIKDKTSGESLQYAFIEFEKEEDCENAYFKMDNVLIDDRRIHVDFSQSVSKLNWNSQNQYPKQNSGRFQNFQIKDRDKRSDGYEMIFDMERSSTSDRHTDKDRAPRRQKQYSPDPVHRRDDKIHKAHFPSKEKYKQNDKYYKDDETSYKKSTHHSRTYKSDRGYNDKELSSKEKSRSREYRSPAKEKSRSREYRSPAKEKSRSREYRSPAKQKSKHNSMHLSDSENNHKKLHKKSHRHDSSSSDHSSRSPSFENRRQKSKSQSYQNSQETLKKRKQNSPEPYSKREHSSKPKYRSQSGSPEKPVDKKKRTTRENPSYRQSLSTSPEISNRRAVKQVNHKSPSTSPESLHREKKVSKSSYRRLQSRSPEYSKRKTTKQARQKSPSTTPEPSYRKKMASKSSNKRSLSRSPESSKRKPLKQSYKSPSSSPESYRKKMVSKNSCRKSQSRSPESSKRKTVKQIYHKSPSTSPESSYRKKMASKSSNRRSLSRSPENSKRILKQAHRSPSASPESSSRKKKAIKNAYKRSHSSSPENSKRTLKQTYRSPSTSPVPSSKKKKASKYVNRSHSRSPENPKRKTATQEYCKSLSPTDIQINRHKKKKASKNSNRSRSRSPKFESKTSKQKYRSRSPELSRQKKNKV